MADEPPPLPPKLKNYSEEDKKRALEEEKRAFEKLERSHSQRAVKNKDKITQAHLRPQTPQEKKSQFYDVNYTSKPIARPVPKPRNVSIQKSDQDSMTLDGNINLPNVNQNDCDLMSFWSPEKPKSNFEDILERLNINKSSYISPIPVNEFSRAPLSSSRSMPYMTNHASGAQIINNLWQGNLPVGNSCVFDKFTQNLNPLQNFHSNFATNTVTKTRMNNFTSNSALNTPRVPHRSPFVDINRMSLAMKQISCGKPTQANFCGLTGSSAKIENPTTICSQTVAEAKTKPISQSQNLIDLGCLTPCDSFNKPVKDILFSSLLEDFDPLSNKLKDEGKLEILSIDNRDSIIKLSDEAQELLRYKSTRSLKDDEQSYYEQVDPFEYMQPSGASTRSDPVIDIYDGLGSPGAFGGDTFDIPPPLPPRTCKMPEDISLRPKRKSTLKSSNSVEKKRSATVFDGKSVTGHIHLMKSHALNADDEAVAFWDKIKKLRAEYIFHDHIGNSGILLSPCQDYSNSLNLSVKLAVYYENADPAFFTCNLNTSVEHVVMQSMEIIKLSGNCTDYLLKVRGLDEYLCGESQLGDYDYVHMCIKNDKDILFTLTAMIKIKKSYLRTVEDDLMVENSDARNLLTVGSTDATYYESLEIAIETFEKELDRLQDAGFQLLAGTPVHELSSPMRSHQVRQVVKQICTLLGRVETCEVSNSINYLIETCRIIQKSQVSGIALLLLHNYFKNLNVRPFMLADLLL